MYRGRFLVVSKSRTYMCKQSELSLPLVISLGCVMFHRPSFCWTDALFMGVFKVSIIFRPVGLGNFEKKERTSSIFPFRSINLDLNWLATRVPINIVNNINVSYFQVPTIRTCYAVQLCKFSCLYSSLSADINFWSDQHDCFRAKYDNLRQNLALVQAVMCPRCWVISNLSG